MIITTTTRIFSAVLCSLLVPGTQRTKPEKLKTEEGESSGALEHATLHSFGCWAAEEEEGRVEESSAAAAAFAAFISFVQSVSARQSAS